MRSQILIFLTLLLGSLSAVDSSPALATKSEDSGRDYHFTTDWFSEHIPTWDEVLADYKGRPGLNYLEVGVFEGRSAIWMLENVLTHPTSRLTAVDVFPLQLKARFAGNLKKSGLAQKAIPVQGYSEIVLRQLPLDTFDIIYIDGSHRARNVLSDVVLSWELLKTGGLLIFDDYRLDVDILPIDLRPKLAIDTFLTSFGNEIETVHRGYQIFVRKIEARCPQYKCTPLGRYSYAWKIRGNELIEIDTDRVVPLTEREQELVEQYAKNKPLGSMDPVLDPVIARDPVFVLLASRLHWDLDSMLKGERLSVEQSGGLQ